MGGLGEGERYVVVPTGLLRYGREAEEPFGHAVVDTRTGRQVRIFEGVVGAGRYGDHYLPAKALAAAMNARGAARELGMARWCREGGG